MVDSEAYESLERENLLLRKQLAELRAELSQSSSYPREDLPVEDAPKQSANNATSNILDLMKRLGAAQEFAPSESMDSVVPMLTIYRSFKHHLRKNKCSENIEFYLDVEDFRSMTSQSARDNQAQHLYDTYIKNGAVREVNISSSERKATVMALRPPVPPDAFEMAQKGVFRLMKNDSYRAFLKTELAAETLKLLRATEANALEETEDPSEEDDDKAGTGQNSNEEAAFREKFKISTSEDLLHIATCSVDRNIIKVPMVGKIAVFTSSWACEGTLFGMRNKLLLRAADVVTVEPLGDDPSAIRVTITQTQDKLMAQKRASSAITTPGNDRIEFRNLIDRDATLRALHESLRRQALAERERDTNTAPKLRQTQSTADINPPGEDSPEDMTDMDWCQLLEGGEGKFFAKDDVVVEEGHRSGMLYQIAWGTVRVERKTYQGESIVLTRMYAGQMFGEVSFLEGNLATASVIADEDGVRIFVIDKHYMESLLSHNPALAGRFYRFLARKMAQITAKEDHVARDLRSKIKILEAKIENLCRMHETSDWSEDDHKKEDTHRDKICTVDLSFARDLWDGYDLARQRVEDGLASVRDIVGLLQKRAEIETDYSKRLLNLGKADTLAAKYTSFMSSQAGDVRHAADIETGTIRTSWGVILEEYRCLGQLHGEWVNKLNGILSDCAAFVAQHDPVRKKLSQEYIQRQTEQSNAADMVTRAKAKYLLLSRESHLLAVKLLNEIRTAQKPDKVNKLKEKLGKSREKAQQAEKEYRQAIQDANTIYDHAMAFAFPTILNGFQEIEESRLRMLRNTFAKLVALESTLSHFKGSAEMHSAVSTIECTSDIQAFIRCNKSKARRKRTPFEFEEFVSDVPTPLQGHVTVSI